MGTETTPPRKPDPLVMPADEFAALRTVAEAAGEQPLTPEEIAGLRERFAAAMANPVPLSVWPSDHWMDRAEAAEAKLAAIAALCRECDECPECGRGERLVKAEDILAIIGSEGDA